MSFDLIRFDLLDTKSLENCPPDKIKELTIKLIDAKIDEPESKQFAVTSPTETASTGPETAHEAREKQETVNKHEKERKEMSSEENGKIKKIKGPSEVKVQGIVVSLMQDADDRTYDVSITDMSGKEVWQKQTLNISGDVPYTFELTWLRKKPEIALAAGKYILRVTAYGKDKTERSDEIITQFELSDEQVMVISGGFRRPIKNHVGDDLEAQLPQPTLPADPPANSVKTTEARVETQNEVELEPEPDLASQDTLNKAILAQQEAMLQALDLATKSNEVATRSHEAIQGACNSIAAFRTETEGLKATVGNAVSQSSADNDKIITALEKVSDTITGKLDTNNKETVEILSNVSKTNQEVHETLDGVSKTNEAVVTQLSSNAEMTVKALEQIADVNKSFAVRLSNIEQTNEEVMKGQAAIALVPKTLGDATQALHDNTAALGGNAAALSQFQTDVSDIKTAINAGLVDIKSELGTLKTDVSAAINVANNPTPSSQSSPPASAAQPAVVQTPPVVNQPAANPPTNPPANPAPPAPQQQAVPVQQLEPWWKQIHGLIILAVITLALFALMALIYAMYRSNSPWVGPMINHAQSTDADRAALAAATIGMNNAHQALEAAADKINLAKALSLITPPTNTINVNVYVTNSPTIVLPPSESRPQASLEQPAAGYAVPNQDQWQQQEQTYVQPVASVPDYAVVVPYQYTSYVIQPAFDFNITGRYHYYNGPSRPVYRHFYGLGPKSGNLACNTGYRGGSGHFGRHR